MGDIEAEEAARKKVETKREQKKISKAVKQSNSEPVVSKTVEADVMELPITDVPKKLSKKKANLGNKYSFAPGKKYAAAVSLVDKTKIYSSSDAIKLVKETSYSKFDGSVELHLNVADKGLRGTVSLPHGTGKQVRVKIADESLIEELTKSGKIDFDILVASPEMMTKLARVAKILGPKGLMPNPKTGTIGTDPKKLADELSKGQVQWKTEMQAPIVHTTIGKTSFADSQLEENFQALVKSIGKDKIKSVFMKATMGPSVKVQL